MYGFAAKTDTSCRASALVYVQHQQQYANNHQTQCYTPSHIGNEPELKEYVLTASFLCLLASNVVVLFVLTHLQITGAKQACRMARMERLHR